MCSLIFHNYSVVFARQVVARLYYTQLKLVFICSVAAVYVKEP